MKSKIKSLGASALSAIFFMMGCASSPTEPTAPKTPPELSLRIPSTCPDHPEDYEILKTKDDPCLFIDGHRLCDISWRSATTKGAPKLTLGTGDLSRFDQFKEMKRKETFKGGEGTFRRDTCDLIFDVEIKGKIKRCFYNRHLKDIQINCP